MGCMSSCIIGQLNIPTYKTFHQQKETSRQNTISKHLFKMAAIILMRFYVNLQFKVLYTLHTFVSEIVEM